MKKTVLGAIILLAGVLSCALMLAGTIGPDWTLNGQIASAWWIMSQKGLAPVFFLFAAIAVVGLIIAILGILEKEEK